MLERMLTGAAVFAAVLCGEPTLLAVLSLYLCAVILVAVFAAATLAPRKPAVQHGRRPPPILMPPP